MNNFFNEQARMRLAVVTLPKGTSPLWTELLVCGEVYADAIKELTSEMTGMVAGSKDGWITEYNKGRAAIYHTLTDEERDAISELCESWNGSGTPKEVKRK